MIFRSRYDMIEPKERNLQKEDRGRTKNMKSLTEKEREMYQYIEKMMGEKGYAPSVRDIQNALGIKSTATVHSYLNKLEEKGYIQKEQGKSRTLRVGNEAQTASSVVRVPILGQVAAGLPILAEQNCEGYLDFCPSRGLSRAELFALRIKGESMIEAGIMSGDFVIVSRTSYVENGDIAVVLLDDEATVKTFYRENGMFRLQPENRDMKPIYTKEVYILGKVIANIRHYH